MKERKKYTFDLRVAGGTIEFDHIIDPDIVFKDTFINNTPGDENLEDHIPDTVGTLSFFLTVSFSADFT